MTIPEMLFFVAALAAVVWTVIDFWYEHKEKYPLSSFKYKYFLRTVPLIIALGAEIYSAVMQEVIPSNPLTALGVGFIFGGGCGWAMKKGQDILVYWFKGDKPKYQESKAA